MIDSNILTTEADEQEQIEENNKKFLYARAVHANHMIQHHMQQILEHQRVVDEYRSMQKNPVLNPAPSPAHCRKGRQS